MVEEHGDESGFMVVDRKASGQGEILQEVF